jgi:hypothetical protein
MHLLASFLLVAFLAIALGLLVGAARRQPGAGLYFANIAEGTHEGSIGRKADGAYTRYLLVKVGSDASHVALAGVADIPLGATDDDSSAAEDLLNVRLLGAQKETILLQPSAAIAAGDFVVAAANGQARTLPVAAGTYYIIGRALTTVSGSFASTGALVEVDPCVPVQRVVT